MQIAYFTHSIVSCWNNGNAHFQRGLLRALGSLGHDAIAYEPAQGWSRENLEAEQGSARLHIFQQNFPDLNARTYRSEADLEQAIDGVDLVIVHEWNEPATVAALGRLRRRNRFTLLFHDTHHRAVSDPAAIRHFDLSAYDGILAFGATLAAIYEQWGWANRVFVLHEAADTTLFRPPNTPTPREGAVWIGNWGEGERTAELETFLLAPAQSAGVTLNVHGVRYPADALDMLRRYGAHYLGWVANDTVPDVFARATFTIHVPRRFYTQVLPGIPTIRVFEALACGIPLICAPWTDSENLFEAGRDYLLAENGETMERHMRDLLHDPALAKHLANTGLQIIEARHSCAVRAKQLIAIAATLHSSRQAA